jgi:glycerol uptake facilitator-like aquaporin
MTFFLVNTIYNAAVSGKAKMAAGAAIGLTLTFAIFLGGPLTGGSLNPARTIGPDVITGDYSDIWIYLVGPIIGGILAAFLYKYLLKPTDEEAE